MRHLVWRILCLKTDRWLYNTRMKQRTAHKVQKQLDRELRHRRWLEKNLKGSTVLKKSRRKVLELYTEKHVLNIPSDIAN